MAGHLTVPWVFRNSQDTADPVALEEGPIGATGLEEYHMRLRRGHRALNRFLENSQIHWFGKVRREAGFMAL